MTAPDALRLLISALESLPVPYLLVGALSVNQYAPPRSTDAADVVIQADSALQSALAEQLQPLARMERQLSFETATGTRRNIVHVTGTNYRIELFHISDDAHDLVRFSRRIRGDLGGTPVWVPTAEDVIIWKLGWALAGERSKDRKDVRAVVAVQSTQLDWPFIRKWCGIHGPSELLREICAALPADLQPPGHSVGSSASRVVAQGSSGSVISGSSCPMGPMRRNDESSRR